MAADASIEDIVAAVLAAIPTPGRSFAWGEVTDDSPLSVCFVGDSVGTRVTGCLGSYTPVIGDTVVLGLVGSKWTVLGEWGAV